ncbi:MAG: hypothetical protein IKI31_02765, partial [Treponema sp.]|nr:hypothetical protein [Treponema sp.]
MNYFFAFMCILNIFLWIFFFVRIRKIFSPTGEIQKIRDEMNKMVRDIDATTQRDADIIDDKILKLRKLIAEADKRISLAQEEEVKNVSLKNMKQSIAEHTYTKAVKDAFKKAQKSLFDDEDEYDVSSVKNETDFQKSSNYKEVPIIEPNIYFSDKPIQKEKSLTEKV